MAIGETVEFEPVAKEDVEIHITVDTGELTPVAVLPKLPIAATGQNGFFLTVAGNPQGIVIEMPSQVTVVEFKIGIKHWFDAIVLVDVLEPDMQVSNQNAWVYLVEYFDV